jgi:membrane associated rhomboid family serine protease
MNVGMDGGVAWWAHVGGFIAGLVAMLILAPSDESSRRAGRTRRTGDQDDDFYF